MLALLFFLIIGFCAIKREAIVGLYLCSVLVIPNTVRAYPIPFSFLLLDSFLFIVWAIIKRGKGRIIKREFPYPLIYCSFITVVEVGLAYLATFFSVGELLNIEFFCNTLILFTICAVWTLTNNQNVGINNKVIVITLLIVSIYGIMTYCLGQNIYMDFLLRNSPNIKILSEISSRYAEETRGALTSRLCGTTPSPLTYAIILNVFLYVLFYIYMKCKRRIIICVILLCLINLFLTGSRGPIVSLIIPLLFFSFLYMNGIGRIKLIVYISMICVMFMILPVFDEYSTYIKSVVFFFNESYSEQADIHGSSVSGRLLQMESAFGLLYEKDLQTLLWGYGRGFHLYFVRNLVISKMETGEFEGALMSGVINYGIIGFFLTYIVPRFFVFLLILKLRTSKRISKKESYLLYSMLTTEVMSSLMVGNNSEVLHYACMFFLMKRMIDNANSQRDVILTIKRYKTSIKNRG